MTDRSPGSDHAAGTGAAPPGMPRWVKVLGIIALLVVAALILAGVLLGGAAEHGPGRHAPGAVSPVVYAVLFDGAPGGDVA